MLSFTSSYQLRSKIMSCEYTLKSSPNRVQSAASAPDWIHHVQLLSWLKLNVRYRPIFHCANYKLAAVFKVLVHRTQQWQLWHSCTLQSPTEAFLSIQVTIQERWRDKLTEATGGKTFHNEKKKKRESLKQVHSLLIRAAEVHEVTFASWQAQGPSC